MEESKAFYANFLGLTMKMDMGWIVTFVSETYNNAQISILHTKNMVIENSGISITIEVSDIDKIYTKAIKNKIKVTYDLTEEDWGVRRFFVKDPNGITINIMSHIITN